MEDMNKENRNITHAACAIITVLMTALFAVAWLGFYNNVAFRTHRGLGGFCSILIWLILYFKFAKTYRAHKIASCAIGEIAFSQVLSIGFADLILYVAGCLAARRYINLLPGAVVVVVQVVTGIIWATKAKQYFLKNVDPQECLLLYDAQVTAASQVARTSFASKLETSYGHLFHMAYCMPVGEDFDAVFAEVYNYPIIVLYDMPLEKRSKIVKLCVNTGKRLYITPTIEDIIARGYDVKHFIDTPLLAYNGSFKVSQTYFGKRALDILVSLLMLVVAAPIMLVVAIAIKLEDGGSVFFRQKRCGQGGKVFSILKFRSMIMDAEKDGKPRPAVAGDARITKVGKVIRATRIDELPQLFNILAGDRAIIRMCNNRTTWSSC